MQQWTRLKEDQASYGLGFALAVDAELFRLTLALVSGRYPAGSGEVAMTSQPAATFNLRIGDVWPETGRSLRVTGLVENPQNLLDDFALVPPGQISYPSQVTVLFDGTPLSVAAFSFPPGTVPVSPQPPGGLSPAIIALGARIGYRVSAEPLRCSMACVYSRPAR